MKIFSNKKQSFPSLPEKVKGSIPPKKILEQIPRDVVEMLGVFAFAKTGGVIKLAAVNPESSSLQQYISEHFGKNVSWFSATQEDVNFILRNYSRDYKEDISQLINSRSKEDTHRIAELADAILEYAITEKASDIHIEPSKNDTSVRFRVDGVLTAMLQIPKDIHQTLIARLKILSNLKIDEFRRPQDGRIELDKYPEIFMRTSSVPTLYGEKMALRILNDAHKILTINNLGISKEQEDILLRNIEKPFGMIVTSGPTGSGKTTTLYALLDLFKKNDINISTLEDPIEYALSGINQIQTNPTVGLTFASGLRTLLRQDPDVIMVGEIRDSETALISADSALTGHLVLTTLHTNDAPSVFTRFLEMRVEDFIVASTVNLVVAQRLVRKVCVSCAKEERLSGIVLEKLRKREGIIRALRNRGMSDTELEGHSFLKGQGCDACFGTGYSGRVGLFEFLEPTNEIRDLILSHASSGNIREAAEKTGYRDIVTDGVEKVFSGVSTFEEVLRATKDM